MVASETSAARAAHDRRRCPAATRSASQISRSSRCSVRSTPSSVVIFSPSFGEPHDDAAPREPVEVERVQRAAAFEHHVVGDVDDVADRAHAREHEPALQPVGRLPHRHASRPSRRSRGQRSGASTTTVAPSIESTRRAADRRSGTVERQAEVRGELARDADDAHRVGPVGRDREVEHDVVESEHLAHVGTERGVGRAARGCRRGRRRGRARAPSTACPRDTSPRILRRSIVKSPGRCAPTVRERHDHPRFDVGRAAHHAHDAVARRRRRRAGCGRRRDAGAPRGCAPTTTPPISRPGSSIASTSSPSWFERVGDLVGAPPSTGVNSRIQDRGARTAGLRTARRSGRRRPRGS